MSTNDTLRILDIPPLHTFKSLKKAKRKKRISNLLMDLIQIRDYCLSKPHVEESFPFDKDTLVFKVMGKMYALLPLKKWESGAPSINLKCDPEYAIELRDLYHSVQPGFHMSKKHWNTIYFSDLDLEPQLVLELIDHSYNLVVKGLPAKLRKML